MIPREVAVERRDVSNAMDAISSDQTPTAMRRRELRLEEGTGFMAVLLLTTSLLHADKRLESLVEKGVSGRDESFSAGMCYKLSLTKTGLALSDPSRGACPLFQNRLLSPSSIFCN